jgi:hypothetical protein
MHGGLASPSGGVRVDRDARHPGQILAGEYERPPVSLLARDARVHKDVLELPGAAAADRPHAKARSAKAEAQLQAGSQVRGAGVIASSAGAHVELRLVTGGGLRGHDLHELPHDTETQTSGQIDAPAPPTVPRQVQHRLEILPR